MKGSIKLIIGLVVIYLLGILTFSLMTYPKTYVSGGDAGFQTLDTAMDVTRENQSMKIIGRNNKETTLNARDISYIERVVPGQKINQNAFLWPIEIFQTHNYEPEYDYSYSQQKLEDFLLNSQLFNNNIEPQDARLVEDSGKYVIQEEVEGDTLDINITKENVIKAFVEGNDIFELSMEYLQPSIRKDDPILLAKEKEINTIQSLRIDFNMGDGLESIGGDRLLDIYSYANNIYTPLREQAYEYVRLLAVEYDTFGTNHVREFETTNKGKIEVEGGIYGWQIDVDATTDEFMEALENFEYKEIIPTYMNEGLTRGKDDIGDTYIEVSIEEQHLWFYKDGNLVVETDVVTGDPSRGVSTPKGVNKVWSKEEDRALVGIVPEGTADYSSQVDFWMPVDWEGTGIHNSTWRNEFGGNIFQGAGSYGCVNLPYDPSEKIFENVELNTPVIIY